jgi:hypothetical protein
MEAFTFDGEGPPVGDPSSLTTIRAKVEEAYQLEQAVEQLEGDLKATKAAAHNLKTKVIPDMMAEIGITELAGEGWRIKLGDVVSGSLPSDPERREKAINWLEDHGGGDLIKTGVSLTFSKSQHNEALSVAEELREKGLEPKVDSTVHPQSLAAFARERMKNGEEIDTETLGLYTARVAKFDNRRK